MTVVRKMFVVPCELFESMLQKNRITDNPILTAQVEIEKEKSKIRNEIPTETSLASYNNLNIEQDILNQERTKDGLVNTMCTKPSNQTDIFLHDQPKKKKFIRKKRMQHKSVKPVKPINNLDVPPIIKHFYDYEPDVATDKSMKRVVVSPTAPRNISSPKKTRSSKHY